MPLDKKIHLDFIGPDEVDHAIAALDLTLNDGAGTGRKAQESLAAADFSLGLDTTACESALTEAYEAIAAAMGWILVGRRMS